MVDSIGLRRHPGQSVYADQINRATWRKEMLSQMLEKMRVAEPEMEKTHALLASPTSKGGLLDVYI